jgi:hypothetical protein
MALSFLSLPPEVRNEIYGYLFDEEHGIQLTHYYHEDYPINHASNSMVTSPKASNEAELRTYTSDFTVKPRSIGTAIFYTSWQTYHESCCLLYARTAFEFFFLRYPKLAASCKIKIEGSGFPKQSLQHVQDLMIRLDRTNRVPFDIIVETIAALVNEACALRRLIVKFDVFNSYIDGPDVAWVQSVLHNEGVSRSLTTSKSLRYIFITVCDKKLTEGDGFGALSQAIATAKGWVCEEQDDDAGPNEANPDDCGSERSWLLQPASPDLNAGSLELIS